MMEGILRELIAQSMRDSEPTRARVHDTPNVANQVQYPEEFNNSVPVIIAAPMQKAKIPTIILATQSKGYTEESFRTDVRKTLDYFELEPHMYQEVLLKPAREDLDVLDLADAMNKLGQVVDMMNKAYVLAVKETEKSGRTTLPTGETVHSRKREEIIVTTSSAYALRIVSLGIASPHRFIFHALEYMLNHWRAPNKFVQFITDGEIEHGEYLNFWTSACINQLVEAVQFVNLLGYLPFGYYDGKCKKLHRTGQVYQPTEHSALMPANTPSTTD